MEKAKGYYYTVTNKSQGGYKEKGSKFIGFVYPVVNEDDIQKSLAEVKSLHPKAKHHCYAYRIGMDRNNYRANDDGEPSGTAGRPILRVIDRYQLTNTLVVVVRYFGGTKLGVSGLISAYKQATDDTLANAEIIQKYITINYELRFEYSHLGIIMDHIKSMGLEIYQQELETKPIIEVKIRQSGAEEQINKLKAALLHRPVKDITKDTSVPFCKISKLC